ncbi:MAG: hypothetical protein KBD23_06090 [Gammaproteobacteria bacterium]|nr:hypothetical protein [Gammaproteobacteria bacterium]MBP9729683.1 hypothetical protein [Gammaproteobacteria bacterium]
MIEQTGDQKLSETASNLTMQNEPTTAETLRLLAKLYQSNLDFEALLALLPTLAKQLVFDTQTLSALEYTTYESLLPVYAQQGLEALSHFWKEMPHALQRNARMLHNYANHLIKEEAYREAEEILLALLKNKTTVQSEISA